MSFDSSNEVLVWTIGTPQLSSFLLMVHSGSARMNTLFFRNCFFSYFRIRRLYSRLFCIWKLRIAISRCFLRYFPAIVIRMFWSSNSEIFSFREKVEHDRLHSKFLKIKFPPKITYFVFLKVKLPNMTDWHILPGLEIDVLIACCRLPVSPQNTECCSRYSASGHLQQFAADLSLSTSQNSPLYKIVTLSLNSNQNFHKSAP